MSDTLEVLSPPDAAAWDGLAAEAEDATVFHRSAWARLWSAAWPGARWQAIALRDGGVLAAGLGFIARHGPGGSRILSMPDGTYGGPLVRRGLSDPARARRLLLEEWGRMARARGVLASQLTWLDGDRGQAPAGLERDEGFTQVVALGSDFPAAFQRLSHGIRSRVRQAEESGLALRAVMEPAGVRAYHDLVVRNARRHGSRPRPLSLYLGVLEHLVPLGLARFDLVEREGAVVGGGLHLLDGRRAMNWLTVADEAQRQLRPTHLVIAHWLRELSARGYREYDLGGSPAGAKGLIEFKESWGAARRPVLTLRRRSLLHRLLGR